MMVYSHVNVGVARLVSNSFGIKVTKTDIILESYLVICMDYSGVLGSGHDGVQVGVLRVERAESGLRARQPAADHLQRLAVLLLRYARRQGPFLNPLGEDLVGKN